LLLKKEKTVQGINAMYAAKKDRGNPSRLMIESALQMEPILNKALEKHWRHLNIRAA